MFTDVEVKICRVCNSVIFEDGTAENCGGECDRELSIQEPLDALNFDEDGVVRDPPELDVYWDEDYSSIED